VRLQGVTLKARSEASDISSEDWRHSRQKEGANVEGQIDEERAEEAEEETLVVSRGPIPRASLARRFFVGRFATLWP
jgi:hypothetical protein